MADQGRRALPKATDRLPLGYSGLRVSPLCIGATLEPETIPAAYDAGINFFFVSNDFHWPLYEATRKGLEMLLARGPGIRDSIVVGGISYIDGPMFSDLQFNEFIGAVPGLGRVDLMIGGGFVDELPMPPRLQGLAAGVARGMHGSRAIGGTFHSRRHALHAANANVLDIEYIRYNVSHQGANSDLFPYLRQDRRSLVYSFKSTMFWTSQMRFEQLGLGAEYWQPHPTDHYRFVLSNPFINGLLCSPFTPKQVEGIVEALDKGSLTVDEQRYMGWLASLG